MGEDELSTVETLKKYREIIYSLVRQYSGRVVDSPGDNILAEFGSVVDAVECAVKIQEDLQEKNANLPDNRRMEFRIGVNLGDVLHDEGRIYGDGVNVAARLEGLADPGGVCISGTAFDQIGNKLPLGYEYLGKQEVKNIEKPVRAYRVLTEPDAAGKVIGEEGPKAKRWPLAAIAVVVILVLGSLALWNFYLRPDVEPASVEEMAFPLPDKPSIAVLPFDNMSADPKQEFFCDGITEEIITGLSKVPELFVIARNSSFTYKGKPVKVQQVAQDLGVRYVLEGSVRKSQNNLRITAQLIDAIKGHHMWADRWDRELKEVFAIQDEITMKILTAMQVKLTAKEQARIVAKGTNNIDAYLKVLEANETVALFNQKSNVLARELAKEAIELDPQYAFAYTILGKTHMLEVWLGTTRSPKKSIAQAMQLARTAIDIDESIGRARGLLGFLYTMTSQHEKGIIETEKAVSLEPNSDLAHQYLGLALRFGGRPNDAIPVIKKAIRLNPFAPSTYVFNLGLSYLFSGRYKEGITECQKATTREPDNLGAQLALTVAYALSGREKEARSTAEEVLRLNPKFSLEHFSRSLAYKNKADKERYLSSLRKAGLPDKPPLPLPDKPSISVLPFENMSGDPEQEYFSDGLTEDIITALSKTPKLFVIARHSSFTYKGKSVSIPTVGRELGVRYVLEGSVRKSGDTLRVTAQLIDAKTNEHLWAEQYDRYLKDIFAVQDDITKNIITSVHVQLTAGEQGRLYAKGTANLDAYLKTSEASWYLRQSTKEGLLKAKRLAEEAIALDPNYPSAYSTLGMFHGISPWLGMSKSPAESLKRAIELSQKAITLDDSFAPAHVGLGYWLTMARQHEKAIAEGERAMALEPSSADVIHNYAAILSYAGRREEAIPLFREALRLNPMPPNSYYRHFGMTLREAGHYEEAIAMIKKAIDKEPNDLLAHVGMAVNYIYAGRMDEARAAAKGVLRINPKFSADRYGKVMPNKDPAVTARIVEALKKAGLK